LTLPCDALPSRLTQAMIAQASRSSSIPNSSSNVMGSHLVLVVGVNPLFVVSPEGGQSINNAHSPYEIWR